MMIRMKTCLAVAALALAMTGFFAAPAAALTPDEAAALPERSLGSATAPVTIIEYASLTCGHCAQFHTQILPQLKERYIDTGKVRLVFRDYPLDGGALRAAAVARCMPESTYHAYIAMLFKSQADWAANQDPGKVLVQYAKLGGLSGADAEACVASDKLMDAIAEGRLKADQYYDIKSTPTFILNEGKAKIVGAAPIEQFAEKIEALLAAPAPRQ